MARKSKLEAPIVDALEGLQAWDGLDVAVAATAVDRYRALASVVGANPRSVRRLTTAEGTRRLLRLTGMARVALLGLVGHSLRAQCEADFALAGRLDLLTEQLDNAIAIVSRALTPIMDATTSARS